MDEKCVTQCADSPPQNDEREQIKERLIFGIHQAKHFPYNIQDQESLVRDLLGEARTHVGKIRSLSNDKHRAGCQVANLTNQLEKLSNV